MSSVPPLPARLAWFAPWRWCSHWKPWTRWTLITAAMLVGYVLSPVPVLTLLEVLGIPSDAVIETVYYPLLWIDERNPTIVSDFYEPQFETLDFLLNRHQQ